jgi:UDP-N-acetylmuramate dehydrogenase
MRTEGVLYPDEGMTVHLGAAERLLELPHLTLLRDVPLSTYTRFGIGGPASLICDIADGQTFVAALGLIRESRIQHVLLGCGTNLIVSDAGFDGVVLRFTGNAIHRHGTRLHVEAGASLQAVVDYSIEQGLKGMQTMTGIPGWLGAAIYGNAGAYGHSIQERVDKVVFSDGKRISSFSNAECQFHYRESVFKERKDLVILSAELSFEEGDAKELRERAGEIRTIRDRKYPPTMKCAGSIFKNCLFAELPDSARKEVPSQLIREGKVPSAFFLEAVGVKGMRRGDIQVADYHANLIYNDGNGTADDLVSVITELKQRVRQHFGFDLEEEVQYVGFDHVALSAT